MIGIFLSKEGAVARAAEHAEKENAQFQEWNGDSDEGDFGLWVPCSEPHEHGEVLYKRGELYEIEVAQMEVQP